MCVSTPILHAAPFVWSAAACAREFAGHPEPDMTRSPSTECVPVLYQYVPRRDALPGVLHLWRRCGVGVCFAAMLRSRTTSACICWRLAAFQGAQRRVVTGRCGRSRYRRPSGLCRRRCPRRRRRARVHPSAHPLSGSVRRQVRSPALAPSSQRWRQHLPDLVPQGGVAAVPGTCSARHVPRPSRQ